MKKQETFFNRRFLWALVLILPLVILLLGRSQQPARETAGDDAAGAAPTAGFQLVDTAGAPARQRALPVESWESAGAKVLFMRADEVPILDVRLVFNAGAARDGELPGLAQMTSSLLGEGTRSRDAGAVATVFESVGADFSTSSHRDMGIVELRTLADDRFRGPAVGMLKEILAEPAFAAEALERERKKMLAALRRQAQSPGGIMSLRFYPELYGDHPYGIPAAGTPASLARIEAQQVRDFYRRYYNRGNLVIVVVGAVSTEEARTLSDEIAEALPEGRPAPPIPPPAPAPGRSVQVPFESQQAHIQIGMPSVRRDDADLVALMVGNEIFGGGGLTSELYRLIREERGLAYSVYSYFSAMQAEGPFGIGLQTRADQADEAIRLVQEALRDFLANGPTEEQVREARRHLAGSFPLQTASNDAITGHLGSIGFYDLPLDYLETYVARVNAVTREDVIGAFRRHVDPERLLLIRVGPESATVQEGP